MPPPSGSDDDSDLLTSSPPTYRQGPEWTPRLLDQYLQQHSSTSSESGKMSVPKDSPASSRPLPSKRASSFAGFFTKLLPSHRPEQGSTLRVKDALGDTDSAYEDLGMDPNELRDWNLARDGGRSLGAASATAPAEMGHGILRSRTLKRADSKFVEDLPSSVTRHKNQHQAAGQRHPQSETPMPMPMPSRVPTPPPPLQAYPRKPVEASPQADDVAAQLKAKEDSRRGRRSLKESGDWLGVQGADPYSGEFSVLTPTDTISSESTTPSARQRLAALARKKRAAGAELLRASQAEERERERARAQRQQTKLHKIEQAKADIRHSQQHDFARWNQQKRQWSTAVEPNLSPIAQSLSSQQAYSSECSSHIELGAAAETSSSSPLAVHGGATPTSNGPRPAQSPARAAQASYFDASGRPSLEGVVPQVRGLEPSPSDETVIHNSATRPRPVSAFPPTPAIPMPPPEPKSTAAPELVRSKSEKHFLWRRRRSLGAPGAGKTPAAANTTTSPASPLPPRLPADHLADVAIPDYRLHLLTPEPGQQRPDHRWTLPANLTADAIAGVHDGTEGEDLSALAQMTNMPPRPREEKPGPSSYSSSSSSPDGSEATATSSPSTLRGIMKRHSDPQKLDPSPLTTTFISPTEGPQEEQQEQISRPAPTASGPESTRSTSKDFSGDTLVSPSEHLPTEDQGERTSFEGESHHGSGTHHARSRASTNTSMSMSMSMSTNQPGSASTPITTTTGSARDQPPNRDGNTPPAAILPDGGGQLPDGSSVEVDETLLARVTTANQDGNTPPAAIPPNGSSVEVDETLLARVTTANNVNNNSQTPATTAFGAPLFPSQERGWKRGTSFPPATPPSASPSPAPGRETAGIATASVRHVTEGGGANSTPAAPPPYNASAEGKSGPGIQTMQTQAKGVSLLERRASGKGNQHQQQQKPTPVTVCARPRPAALVRQPSPAAADNELLHQGTMIQEAARIAMLRSRATTVMHYYSSSSSSHGGSRTPSPKTPPEYIGGGGANKKALVVAPWPHSATALPAVKAATTITTTTGTTKTSAGPTKIKVKAMGETSGGGAPPSSPSKAKTKTNKSTTTTATGQQQHDAAATATIATSELDPIATAGRALRALGLVALGLLLAWWRAARPALDGDSALWRRRRRRRSTWADAGHFAAAAGAGALLAWGVLRVVLWWHFRAVVGEGAR
ncbi:hypothetical protein GGR56DRAFT_681430 [Xylariaceae sp. FL0804]|nr:hypothetical protein GGR56DRAFT_681430 [Xylariaceae sp. FL0804]